MPDELESLLGLYDSGNLSRRQLVHALVALGAGPYLAPSVARELREREESSALFQTRTLNHVTLVTSNVARSKSFYQRLTGLPIRAEDKDFCEFRLENGFLGIYEPDPGQQPGFNHFCFGIEKYDPQTTLNALKKAMPDAKVTLEGNDQVYVEDPDGVRVQFADVRYKR